MKKRIAFAMTLVLLLSTLAGCAGTTVVVGNCTCPTEPAADNTPVEAPVAAEGALKTGLAIVPAASAESKDGNTKLSYDVTVVAVTVDANGVIQSCIVDSLNPSVEVDGTGAIVSDVGAPIATKNELGEAYGMKAYAGSKYEWNEQAAAVADYAVGKTAEEFKNGAVSEAGMAADVDLASKATIYIGGYVSAIVEAANNAQDLGAQAGDTLKLAIMPSLASSTAATAEAAGNVQLDVDIVAMTMNGETITSCYLDAVQAKVAVNTAGAVTIPEGGFQTKNQLGEAYGMKAYAGANYEWNEQAANFSKYVTGKTAADVAGIAVAEGKPADADLAAKVTIAIGGFQGLIAKAAQ